MASSTFYGTGRRKSSIARVYLTPGTGKVTINKKDIDDYFGLETLKIIARQPLEATNTADKYDVKVTVKGGGFTGQAGAIRHGIARALNEADADFRPILKKAGFLTRDSRMKEKKEIRLEESSSCTTVLQTLVFGNKIITTSGTELFPMFFYILVLGDLDSNFLYYGQPFWGGVGGLNLCICDGGQPSWGSG